MPRRTFHTARRRTAKWSPHLLVQSISFETSSGDFGSYQLLAKNSTDTTVPVPSIIKVKNFRVSIDTSVPSVANYPNYLNVYLMYIPEGVTMTSDTPRNHPEWILAWKGINAISHADKEGIVLSSRLSRNLNSGDGVYLLFSGNSSSNITLNFVATSTYVSRAN